MFRNFTPHNLTIFLEDGQTVLLDLPSEGQVRVGEEIKNSFSIDGIAVGEKQYTTVELPDGDYDRDYLIVSKMVLDALEEHQRPHCLCPDTGPDSVVRDEQGRIVGVRRLQK
jgi:hypothetical protein